MNPLEILKLICALSFIGFWYWFLFIKEFKSNDEFALDTNNTSKENK